MTRRDVVVCLVSDTFADAGRRNFYSTADQTILSLVASPRIRRILVVDHPRGLASQVKRRLRGDGPAPRSGKLRGVRPVMLRTAVPSDVDALRRRYRAFDTQIAAAARFHGLRNPALITFNLFHAGFGARAWAGGSIFYAQDDEAQLPRLQPWREPIDKAYRQAADRHRVVAVSGELARRISATGSTVIANGIDPTLWRHLPTRVAVSATAPTIAYAGTIDQRVDTQAFVTLAGAGFSVMLAGPVPDATVRATLSSTPGVELLGTLGRDGVVALLRSADVCVLAHTRSALTDAMSPLKLFEYRASGTPVVATDLSGIREAWPDGNLVQPGGDYASAVVRAIAAGRMDEGTRLALVDTYSWRTRHEALLDLI